MTRTLIALLAIACIGATALVVMTVLRADPPAAVQQAQGNQAFRGGVVGESEHDPPKLIELPAFTLTERSGEGVSLGDLEGTPWIATFIFTRCMGPCPMITSKTAMLQMDLQKKPYWDDVRLVTITVDPDHDTPAVLAERADMALADETHWLWLTGDRPAVWTLIRDGFKLPVDDDKENKTMPIMHSQKFVLVDGDGWIRGFYDALENEDYAAMIADLEKTLTE